MLKVQRPKVFGLSNDLRGFGDSWAAASYLLSEGGTVYFRGPHANRVVWISRYLAGTGKIVSTTDKATVELGYCKVFRRPFLRTKTTWKGTGGKLVAYQFDGRHLSYQKNPKKDEIRAFRSKLEKHGFNPVDIGGEKKIGWVIDVLSRADFFVGVVSGMAKVAISVGTPMHIVTNDLSLKFVNYVKGCQFKNRPVNYHHRLGDFLSQVSIFGKGLL